MPFCIECGEESEEGAKFCNKCGKELQLSGISKSKSKDRRKGLFSPWCPECNKYKGRYPQCPHCGFNENTGKIEPLKPVETPVMPPAVEEKEEKAVVEKPPEPSKKTTVAAKKEGGDTTKYIVILLVLVVAVGVWKPFSKTSEEAVQYTYPPSTTSPPYFRETPRPTTPPPPPKTEIYYEEVPYEEEVCEWVDPYYNIDWGAWGTGNYENIDVIITNEEDQSITVKLTIGFFAGGSFLSSGLELERTTKTVTLGSNARKTVNFGWTIERNFYSNADAIIIDEIADRIKKCETVTKYKTVEKTRTVTR